MKNCKIPAGRDGDTDSNTDTDKYKDRYTDRVKDRVKDHKQLINRIKATDIFDKIDRTDIFLTELIYETQKFDFNRRFQQRGNSPRTRDSQRV